jgi:formate-dependent nitrite reductase membrane component NrfD
MIDVRLTLVGIAVLLMLVGLVVFRRQMRATSCPRHSRFAGRLAMIIGWASLIGGMGLLGYALLLSRT